MAEASSNTTESAINESVFSYVPDWDKLRNDCNERLEAHANSNVGAQSDPHCPGVFDGWLCWPDTPAGETAYELCPGFITGFDTARKAHRECEPDGSWFRHPESNHSWSNYTTCLNFDDFERNTSVNTIFEIGYCISLIAILISLGIFTYFKSLKCPRITLHMNLFISFALNNFLWLIWYFVVLPDLELLQSSPPYCIALYVILHYFMLANYFWMLCEGLYLHTVLVWTFINNEKAVKWLFGVGWGMPVPITLIYVLTRGYYGSGADIEFCWMNETVYQNILIVPVAISMVLNAVFLVNIVRVLRGKINAPSTISGSNNTPSMLATFRAALWLAPLLGLQYILTGIRANEISSEWRYRYEAFTAITISFQGFFVALLFCFCNGEVRTQIKRKFGSSMPWMGERHRGNSYAGTQVSFVRHNSRVPGEEKI